jgi:hypothetical protein
VSFNMREAHGSWFLKKKKKKNIYFRHALVMHNNFID